VDRLYRFLILPGTLVGLGAWLAFANNSTGDYPMDAAPAVSALGHGHIATYLEARPAMGPLATLLEAPLALLGHGPLGEYHWASMVGIVAVAALGWLLFDVARRHGSSEPTATLLAVLCVVNPITAEALRTGHPEELLTAALAVGSVVVATRGHSTRAGLLLGLAIASKQWAVLAVFPVLMALPDRRRQAAAVAVAVLAAFTLPGLIASPDSFLHVQNQAASGGVRASIWSAWYPLARVETRALPNLGITVPVHEIPTLLRPLTHPMIVASFFVVPLALWARRGTVHLDAPIAVALFALLALLRCALDPVDNLYYHAPLLLALLAWDAIRPIGRLPFRGLAGAAIVFIFWRWSSNLADLDAFNFAYLAVVVAAAALLARHLLADGAKHDDTVCHAEPPRSRRVATRQAQ
jgi:Glycosyltransferase family 87